MQLLRIELRSIPWQGIILTTRPLVLLPLYISITYFYFRHAVLPNSINLSFTSQIKKKKKEKENKAP